MDQLDDGHLHVRGGVPGEVEVDPSGATPSQLYPAIILMSGGAHDGGMLQISLFTSRSQNQVSGKLWKSGFWK